MLILFIQHIIYTCKYIESSSLSSWIFLFGGGGGVLDQCCYSIENQLKGCKSQFFYIITNKVVLMITFGKT